MSNGNDAQVVVAIGTRPDVIKMWPVIEALETAEIPHRVWWSGQGGDIQPLVKDELEVDEGKCKWKNLTARNIAETIEDFTYFIMQEALDVKLVLVHGDDATAYACAIAAHALDIPIGHVEAGMRTYERDPWPEEQFRQVIGRLASLHFCPSEIERGNLHGEHVQGRVHVTGNTINDVLSSLYPFSVLVTCHRRENALLPTQNLLDALAAFEGAHRGYVDIEVITHPNWQGRYRLPKNLTFTDPIRDHGEFLEKLREVDVVITDSGGLQEECAFLGVPCIVYRAETERKSLENRELIVVTQNLDDIIDGLELRLDTQQVYGKGDAADRIISIIRNFLTSPREQFGYPYINDSERWPETEADLPIIEHLGKGVSCTCPLCFPLKYELNRAARANFQNPTHLVGFPEDFEKAKAILDATDHQNPSQSDLCLPNCDCNRHTQDAAEKEVSPDPDPAPLPPPNFGRLSTDWHIWDDA